MVWHPLKKLVLHKKSFEAGVGSIRCNPKLRQFYIICEKWRKDLLVQFGKCIWFSKSFLSPEGHPIHCLLLVSTVKTHGRKTREGCNNIWKSNFKIWFQSSYLCLVHSGWSHPNLMMWRSRSVKMETRWLGNVSNTLMVIVPYSLPSLKSDLSENMALLLQVSCSWL